jgi:large subunit ribosomal protein L22
MERPMNTASRDRAVHKIISEFIKSSDHRHTPVNRVKVARDVSGAVNVSIFTGKPTVLRNERTALANTLSDEFQSKTVNVLIVPEATAVAKFVRLSPRKARLVIDAIKGKRVVEALNMLRFIPNRAAEPLTKVLESAAANAQESWGAGPEDLKIANFIADGGPVLKRMHPRAQGRGYRILKRTSHLTVVLQEAPAPVVRRRPAAAAGRNAVTKRAASTPAAAGAA